MTEFFCGVVGALLVVLCMMAGAVLGWIAHAAVYRYGKPEIERPGETERRKLKEEEQAFLDMMAYNTDTAYGIKTGSLGQGGGD